jgi:hypothetical protein
MDLLTYEEFSSLNEAKMTSDRNHPIAVKHGLDLLDQTRIFHWQTEVGDAHKALGEFYEDFSELNDSLVETTMGKYGRIALKGLPKEPYMDLAEVNLQDYYTKYEIIYDKEVRSYFPDDSSIKNIVDEIVGAIQKLKYLLTMS